MVIQKQCSIEWIKKYLFSGIYKSKTRNQFGIIFALLRGHMRQTFKLKNENQAVIKAKL
jgi:hypothetical protein